MLTIFRKEIHAFFSSPIGYIAIGVFLVILGLFVFFFPDSSILEYNYSTLAPLFDTAPLVFLFLIPAVTMRMFAEEQQNGTIEFLATKPLREIDIILGKYLAALALVLFSLIPTLLYWYTAYQLGSPKGNLDAGAIIGSYLGLFLLAGIFTAVGIFASSLSSNQILAFLLATFLCFLLYYGFFYFSRLPVFVGRWDDLIQKLGIDYHYNSISRGLIDSRDMVYFGSVTALFLMMTLVSLERRKW
jgi:ABC-2 type transport system permease protein